MDGMPKKPCGRKQHAPTDAQRKLVELHATVGTTQDMIARVIGIDKKTLRLHYRDELDLSMAKANATIGGALFNKAKGGDTASMTFWAQATLILDLFLFLFLTYRPRSILDILGTGLPQTASFFLLYIIFNASIL